MIRLLTFAALAAATPALAQSTPPAMAPPQPLSQSDQQFLTYAAEDNQAEIALCLLAEKRADSPAVKAFARLMVDDHVQIESELAAVADAQKAKLPEGVGEDGKKTHDKLDPLDGKEFDAAFMKAQIKDHGNDIKRFAQQVSSTNNKNLRRYASETGPILSQHLALAMAVQGSVKPLQ